MGRPGRSITLMRTSSSVCEVTCQSPLVGAPAAASPAGNTCSGNTGSAPGPAALVTSTVMRVTLDRGQRVEPIIGVRPILVARSRQRRNDIARGYGTPVAPRCGTQRVDEAASVGRRRPRGGQPGPDVDRKGCERGEGRVLELHDLARHRAGRLGRVERTDRPDDADRRTHRLGRGRDAGRGNGQDRGGERERTP